MGVAVAVEKGAGMAEASLRQDPLLTDYICCISMLFLVYFFNDCVGDLTTNQRRLVKLEETVIPTSFRGKCEEAKSLALCCSRFGLHYQNVTYFYLLSIASLSSNTAVGIYLWEYIV